MNRRTHALWAVSLLIAFTTIGCDETASEPQDEQQRATSETPDEPQKGTSAEESPADLLDINHLIDARSHDDDWYLSSEDREFYREVFVFQFVSLAETAGTDRLVAFRLKNDAFHKLTGSQQRVFMAAYDTRSKAFLQLGFDVEKAARQHAENGETEEARRYIGAMRTVAKANMHEDAIGIGYESARAIFVRAEQLANELNLDNE